MRVLEVVLTILLFVSVYSLFSKRFINPWILCALNGFVLIAHIIVEGAHWQMIPEYTAVFLYPITLMWPMPRMRRSAAWAMIILCLATCASSAVLPMFRLPKPTGPFAIGTQVLYLVDHSRFEDTEHGGHRARELVVQIWYPASPSHLPRAPYRRLAETNLTSSYQSVLWTHARWNAPLAAQAERFPVLLFNPAWTGRRTQNTYLEEDLVSHGYVVVGIDHPNNSGPTAYPDGRVAQPIASGTGIDFNTSLEEVNAAGSAEIVKQTADTIFVLDEMQRLAGDQMSVFYGRLDTSNAGAFGHSFGGAVAAEACLADPRIKSALDMDGSFFGQVQQRGLSKPLMVIEEDGILPTAQELQRMPKAQRIDAELDMQDLRVLQRSGGIRIVLHGSTHPSFTDRNLFSPFPALSGVGAIPTDREYAIIRQYALAFFDKTLRGQDPALLKNSTSPFPEASLDVVTGER